MNHKVLANALNVMMRHQAAKPNVSMRFMALQDVQLRAEPGQDPNKPYQFSGYAVKWASINSHREKFQKGAFADFINAVKANSHKCHMYYNHGWSLLYINPVFAMRIGKWLDFEEDDVGLQVVGEITPGMRLASDVQAMIAHGTIDGLSIGFYPPNEMDLEYFDDHVLIKRVSLYEISPCDEPSDRDARLTDDDVRNIESEDDLKQFLKRFNLNEDTTDQLIQRVKSFGKVKDDHQPVDAFAWLDQA